MSPFIFYISSILFFIFSACLFEKMKFREVRNYFFIQVIIFLILWALIAFIYKAPQVNIRDAINVWYEISIFIPKLLGENQLEELQLSLSFYDAYFLASSVGLMYLFVNMLFTKNRSKPCTKKKNEYFIFFILITGNFLFIYFYGSKKTSLIATTYEYIWIFIAIIVKPLSINLFYTGNRISGYVCYLFFTCYGGLFYIMVFLLKLNLDNSLANPLYGLFFYSLWYFFAYGRNLSAQFKYLLLILFSILLGLLAGGI